MSSDSVPLRPPVTRDTAGTLLGQTMGLVAITAGLFAVGAYLRRNLASPAFRRSQAIRAAPLLAASIFLESSTCSFSCCHSSAAAGAS